MPPAPQEIRTYFITTVTANRRRLFQIEQNAYLFIEVLQEQRIKKRLQLHAFVIMPDHIHLLLTPTREISLEKVMQFIKGSFSFASRASWTSGSEVMTAVASPTHATTQLIRLTSIKIRSVRVSPQTPNLTLTHPPTQPTY